jgi:uncharacterized membrane protein YoaK (UPF0700 family)
LMMILGALAISTAVASAKENSSTNEAVMRECVRYGLDYHKTIMAQAGDEFSGKEQKRRWWDYLIVLVAMTVFVTLGVRAVVPPLAMNLHWVAVLSLLLLISLGAGGWSLWRRTRFC